VKILQLNLSCVIYGLAVGAIRACFKEQESLTVWISDDNNRLPIRIKADLAVGSIKADLEEFKAKQFI
jgi:hypothetical protein